MTRWQPTQCPVCRRLLIHRTGAAIILCPSCHSLLNLLAHPSTPGQTVCLNCSNIIHHPIGPPLLQCRICTATNPAPILNYICRVCSVYLVYSSTLSAVVCPICHNVEPPIDTPLSHIPALLPLIHQAPPRPCPSLPPRHIPWLPSTPVRPVSTPSRPSHQFTSPHPHPSVPLSPPSSPLPPLPISHPHHPHHPHQPIHLAPPQHPPLPPTPLSEPLHQTPLQPTTYPQPPQLPHFPTAPQSTPSPHDNLPVNGDHYQPASENPHDDNAKPVTQPLTSSPSSKNKQGPHFDTKD